MNVDPKILDEFDKMSIEASGKCIKNINFNFHGAFPSIFFFCRNLSGFKD